MATKSVDAAAVTTADETTRTEEDTEQVAEAAAGRDQERAAGEAPAQTTEEIPEETPEEAPAQDSGPSGVGQGAGAVVAAALGVVSLTGSWMGTVASARESLIGQLQTSSSSGVAKMIKEGYGDAWHANALWAGLFALSALVVGVVVLVRPAFGEPGRAQAPWIRSVAWAGVSLGVIGLLLAVLKYTDVLLGLPTTG
ncbi:hypothetical protein ACF1AY_19650 [Streptomyces sp. NPDC014776]|uniref:hypothetical protein n=1 Tax=Streptomyces sp. NPDC014776 TaxID=3364909 RepID=UPI0036F85BD6